MVGYWLAEVLRCCNRGGADSPHSKTVGSRNSGVGPNSLGPVCNQDTTLLRGLRVEAGGQHPIGS